MSVGVKKRISEFLSKFIFFIPILISFFLIQCTWHSNSKESILIIAVEKLAFDKINCETDDSSREGGDFKIFCDEGIKFTHAYTTSTLSQPALASLLTGMYPIEHQVHHNGNQYLSSQLKTNGEAAVDQGFRTAFFSGGPPILRKSGLSQGFEIFDDLFPMQIQQFYRPANEMFRLFLNWLDREVGHEAFFSVIYLADLQFPDFKTQSNTGEKRERTFESQLHAIGEGLNLLKDNLQKLSRWQSTHVILVGLNGQWGSHREDRRLYDESPLDIYANNTQIAFYLKPAQRSTDASPQWTIDKNITLADVGHSIYELIGTTNSNPMFAELPRVSLKNLLQNSRSDWDDDRLILIESGWGQWRNIAPMVRYAFRQEQYFYIHDQIPKVYNILLDRRELNPLPVTDPIWITLRENMNDFFQNHKLDPFLVHKKNSLDQIFSAHKWWSQPPTHVLFSPLKMKAQFYRWQSLWALENKKWEELKKIGEFAQNELTIYVAKRNLGLLSKIPTKGCEILFTRQGRLNSNNLTTNVCSEEILLSLVESITHVDRERRELAFDDFFRRLWLHSFENILGEQNYRQFLTWDLSLDLPTGITTVDLFLALPERTQLSETIRKRLLRENRSLDL
ncbi:MAG: sulfatase-like hydrolase/transferase [Bdellovibrionales bacterium]|nr:sulfatase-like hydrolase/transferase [Bdellovibrionales bacterium]